MVQDYKNFFDQTGLSQSSSGPVGNMAGGSGQESKSLEDLFYQKEMEMAKLAFTRQFTHAIVYAWVKLREQVRANSYHPINKAMSNTTPAGDQKHHLDCGVHRAEPEGPDKQLHQRLLSASSDLYL
jgi:V-type H+-transporting ATPase subunit d